MEDQGRKILRLSSRLMKCKNSPKRRAALKVWERLVFEAGAGISLPEAEIENLDILIKKAEEA